MNFCTRTFASIMNALLDAIYILQFLDRYRPLWFYGHAKLRCFENQWFAPKKRILYYWYESMLSKAGVATENRQLNFSINYINFHARVSQQLTSIIKAHVKEMHQLFSFTTYLCATPMDQIQTRSNTLGTTKCKYLCFSSFVPESKI